MTEEHPFYVTGRGWRKARELSAGERLLGAGGEASIVVSNLGEVHPEGVTVYNLEVEEAHTYFVRAQDSDAEPVWVHNAEYSRFANTEAGTGEYQDVLGHHVHAKQGFLANSVYSSDEAFSLSRDFLLLFRA